MSIDRRPSSVGMQSSDSSTAAAAQHPHLPPGFRFHPTDEELVVHYLKKKAASAPLPVSIITEIDLYKFDPWELPARASFGEQEWYFFSPRDRKYPNGARPNRAATSGYWKATGTDKPILTYGGTHKVGVKKALVFYGGKPPKGVKTNWIMHEYRLVDGTTNLNCRPPQVDSTAGGDKKTSSLRLDDWVLCRIYKKNNSASNGNYSSISSHRPMEEERHNSMEDILGAAAPISLSRPAAIGARQDEKPFPHDQRANASTTTNYTTALMDNEETFLEGLLTGGQADGLHGNPRLNLTSFIHHPIAPPLWADSAGAIAPPPSKRFRTGERSSSSNNNAGENNNNNNNNSNNNDGSHLMMARLLSQMPSHAGGGMGVYESSNSGSSSSTIHLGSLRPNGGGILQQQQQYHQLSGVNWSS